jgi:hypothetical protein
MGVEFSTGKSGIGSIFVQTDKSAYMGGETVTGKLYLNLLTQYPGNMIFLKLKGKEFCAFTQTESKSYTEMENGVQVTKHKDVDIPYDETREVIKMIVPVLGWALLLPGQYTIPFAFMLPADLPSTFHQEGNKYIGDISYQLEGIIDTNTKGQKRIKHKQAFVVRQPIKSAMQGVGNEVKTELKACCSSQGHVTLKTKFEKNYYAPGETAQVIMQLDNSQGKANCESMNLSLKQNLTLKAKGKDKTETYIKVERKITEGCPPAGGVSDSNFIALNLPPFKPETWTPITTINLLDYLKSLKANPGVLCSATKGKFITSEYYLEVSCPMNGCCLNTPSNSCPIEIYYPDITLTIPTPPPGWAPQEMGIVNLSMSGTSATLSNVNVSVNVDPFAMAANTMLAAGNIMAGQTAMMGGMGGMNMTVTTNQQPASTIESNHGTFTVTNQQPQGAFGGNDGFHMTMNTTTSSTHHVEHHDSNGFHSSFTVNH